MQLITNTIAYLVGMFTVPISFLAIGFIVKKSTGKLWGYYIAVIAFSGVFAIIAFNLWYKPHGS